VFVRRGAGEGEGYLMATIFRASENRSDRALFDAAAQDAGPIALAELSHRVPYGFHGNWREEA
jgi:carotenoid cleavage dioxygenase-like enzyme